MKEPQLGSQLKGRAGDLNRASPYGRWPVAPSSHTTQTAQNPAWLLYTCTLDVFQPAAQLVWWTGSQEHALRDRYTEWCTCKLSLWKYNHERRLSTTQLTSNPCLFYVFILVRKAAQLDSKFILSKQLWPVKLLFTNSKYALTTLHNFNLLSLLLGVVPMATLYLSSPSTQNILTTY